MKRALLIFALFTAAPAQAQETSALCQFWTAHKASSAAYQPGVDVHGNPVVPADINAASPALMPSRVTFPLTIDMAQAFNIPVPPGTKMEAGFGMIEAFTDGRVLFNGQDLSAQAQVVCAGGGAATVSAIPVPSPQPQPSQGAPAVQPPEPLKPAAKENNDDIIWGGGY